MNPLLRLFNLKGCVEDGDSLVEWAADEITTLRQQLEQAQAESVQAAQQESVPEPVALLREELVRAIAAAPRKPLKEINGYDIADHLIAEGWTKDPQPEGDWWLRLPGDANNHRCLLYTPSEQAGIEYRIVPAGFVKTVSDATHYIPLKPPTGLKRPQPPQEDE